MDLSRKSAVWAIVVLIGASSGTASTLTPLPQPEAFAGIKPGDPTPFIGHWMMTLPTMEMGTPDADYATCDRPVRIESANEDHIFYFGPDQAEVDPAIQLTPRENGTYWEPIAGGPSYFTLWVAEDMFYLYDEIPQTEADWGRPFVYRRCP